MTKGLCFLLLGTLCLWGTEAKVWESCYADAKSTADTIACMDKEYSEYDRALNRYYVALMKQIRLRSMDVKSEKEKLKKAQRAWIRYRDEKCAFEGYPMRGGSGEGVIVYGCEMRMTKERANELKLYLQEYFDK